MNVWKTLTTAITYATTPSVPIRAHAKMDTWRLETNVKVRYGTVEASNTIITLKLNYHLSVNRYVHYDLSKNISLECS